MPKFKGIAVTQDPAEIRARARLLKAEQQQEQRREDEGTRGTGGAGYAALVRKAKDVKLEKQVERMVDQEAYIPSPQPYPCP